ncbi:MAG: GntR family transcriptional regulator / MocR family aminotransferase [Streptosporangiaceae bacterium]|nr:GntR family transcriptional regulator / MocR family aminotransferase [Streptosporangiaceae bacterium]
MAKTWANQGGDLHLELAGSRVRAGLEAALRDAVQAGRLPPGARLPSSRALAADLGIARNTVADAYGQLAAEGWLAARTGSGTWVTQHRVATPESPGVSQPDVVHPRYDLRPGVPDLSAFPRRAWLTAARKTLSAVPDHVLGYPDPRGLPQLRMALADYLARARGVTVSPGRIVVCAGFAQGLALLCQVLRERGARTIAMEASGHPAHRHLAEAHGLRPVSLPVDAGGAVPDGLGAADAVLLTPAHQFPLGVTLQPQRRRAIVEWVVDTAGLVIEDDYDGEFRYDRQPVGAMQALAPEHMVYAGTASKSLMPGLRLGWLVLPAPLLDEVITAKESAGCLTSSLDQLTLAEFISSGAYDRQIRLARLAYRRRRDRLAAALRRQAPHVRVTGIAAGLHALVELAGPDSEEDVIARAARRGLAIEGLGSYSAAGQHVPGQHGPALVIGYGRPPEHAFTTALARLCAALAGHQSV